VKHTCVGDTSDRASLDEEGISGVVSALVVIHPGVVSKLGGSAKKAEISGRAMHIFQRSLEWASSSNGNARISDLATSEGFAGSVSNYLACESFHQGFFYTPLRGG